MFKKISLHLEMSSKVPNLLTLTQLFCSCPCARTFPKGIPFGTQPDHPQRLSLSLKLLFQKPSQKLLWMLLLRQGFRDTLFRLTRMVHRMTQEQYEKILAEIDFIQDVVRFECGCFIQEIISDLKAMIIEADPARDADNA